ncbi:MAG: hypothetical protein H6715_03035 [Myxococcales bacterium]|nr:hypothetical protein [Myxococcales bacterium]
MLFIDRLTQAATLKVPLQMVARFAMPIPTDHIRRQLHQDPTVHFASLCDVIPGSGAFGQSGYSPPRPDCRIQTPLSAVLHVEVTLRDPDGQPVTISAVPTVLEDQAGNPVARVLDNGDFAIITEDGTPVVFAHRDGAYVALDPHGLPIIVPLFEGDPVAYLARRTHLVGDDGVPLALFDEEGRLVTLETSDGSPLYQLRDDDRIHIDVSVEVVGGTPPNDWLAAAGNGFRLTNLPVLLDMQRGMKKHYASVDQCDTHGDCGGERIYDAGQLDAARVMLAHMCGFIPESIDRVDHAVQEALDMGCHRLMFPMDGAGPYWLDTVSFQFSTDIRLHYNEAERTFYPFGNKEIFERIEADLSDQVIELQEAVTAEFQTRSGKLGADAEDYLNATLTQ